MTLAQSVKRKTHHSRNSFQGKEYKFREKRAITLKETVQTASDCIAPSWNLKSFIARNPLQGLTHLPFEEAVAYYASFKNSLPSDEINRQVSKWCQAFFDSGEALLPMPGREKGFYRSWLALASYDQEINLDDKFLTGLTEDPEKTVRDCLADLQVEERDWESFLRAELLQLKGWASYAKGQDSLMEYLAVRLALTCILLKERPVKWQKAGEMPQLDLSGVKLKEKLYAEELLRKITSNRENKHTPMPEAQLVFCIDTRSEAIRNQIEECGPYQTFGCAGFFNLPIGIYSQSNCVKRNSCPVILNPEHTITAVDSSGSTHFFRKIYLDLKAHFATTFALVETVGAWCAPLMMWKTFSPYFQKSKSVQASISYDFSSIPKEKQVDYADKFLRSIGLTANFSKWVVICGHGSKTTNNLYASALDCGACGGNHGGANAKVMAAILNQVKVRDELSRRGIDISAETTFISAEHETTTDQFHFFEETKEDETLKRLKCKLVQAGQANTRSRLGAPNPRLGEQNACDWSSVRPEWGLAKNASFIIANREVTYGIDLHSRAFLHSYDWENDQDGSVLESILLGPVFVAHWINTQYFFSTIDPEGFGAGSKIFHNLTGKLGVVKGNGGDLMDGLPLESVYLSIDTPFHEPLRLLVVINAPQERVARVLAKHKNLRDLVENEWIFLRTLEP